MHTFSHSEISFGSGPSFDVLMQPAPGMGLSEFVWRVADQLPQARLLRDDGVLEGDHSDLRTQTLPPADRAIYYRSLPDRYACEIRVPLIVIAYDNSDACFCRLIVPGDVAEQLGFDWFALQNYYEDDACIRFCSRFMCLARDIANALSIPSALMNDETNLDLSQMRDGFLCLPTGVARCFDFQGIERTPEWRDAPHLSHVSWHELEQVAVP